MIVIGVDPSSTSTGYGLVEYESKTVRYIDCGCIRPKAGMNFEDRLVFIFDQFSQILDKYKPSASAVESTFFGKDADSAAKLGQARGVLLLALRKAFIPIDDYSPATVKKSIAGSGQASKVRVQFMVMRLLKLDEMPNSLDASDALGIAICHTRKAPDLSSSLPRKRRPEIEALLKRVVRRRK